MTTTMTSERRATQSPAPTAARAAFPWAYFALAFGFSWLVWLPGVLANFGVIDPPLDGELLTPLLLLIGAFGPLVAAVTLTMREAGGAGVRRFLKRGVQFRLPGRWLAVIIGLPMALSAAARYLDMVTGGSPPPTNYSSPLALLPTFIFILLLGGPFQEEYGWRGYALERMAARWGGFRASVALGLIWTAWHLPFWLMEGAGMAGTPLPIYTAYTVGLSVVMAWVYFGSGRNIWAAILLHTMANFVANLFPTHGLVLTDSRAYLLLALFYLAAAGVVWRMGGFKETPAVGER